MPKVAQTFKERAIDFAMTATPEETNEIMVLMKQIAKNRAASENGTPKPARKPRKSRELEREQEALENEMAREKP